MPNNVASHHPNALFALSFCSALICSIVLTGLTARVACTFGWVRMPTSSRHVHTKAIPRLGGVAIFITTGGLLVLGLCIIPFVGVAGESMHALAPIFLPASLLFVVGLVDDWKPLSAKFKLACQVASGVWLYVLGYSVTGLHRWSANDLSLKLVAMAATVLWVVWITNAVNLIDGLDGLAAGSSLFSMITLFIAAYLRGNHSAALGTALLGGALLGFLRHNFNPASIFLGDGGSLFIGFMLSSLGLMHNAQTRAPLVMSIALPALALGLPLLEVMLSVSRRFLSGKRLLEPDRLHIHHRLLDRGLSQRQVVLVLYAASGCFGALALLLVYPTWNVLAASILMLVLLGTCGIKQLSYAEFSELAHLPRRILRQRRVIANAVSLSRATELLHTASTLEQIRSALEVGFPSECFAELRFALLPRHATLPAHCFQLHPADRDMLGEQKQVGLPNACTASVIIHLDSPEFHGSLELVVAAEHGEVMLDMDQLLGKLHPALGGALGRLSLVPARSTEHNGARWPAMLPPPTGLRPLHYV